MDRVTVVVGWREALGSEGVVMVAEPRVHSVDLEKNLTLFFGCFGHGVVMGQRIGWVGGHPVRSLDRDKIEEKETHSLFFLVSILGAVSADEVGQVVGQVWGTGSGQAMVVGRL
jgi:NhaP-type Na+/H+ or K+/H+ antiporter